MGGEPVNVIGERKEAEASNPSVMHLLYLVFHHQRIFIYKAMSYSKKLPVFKVVLAPLVSPSIFAQ